jgi:hypothetical protein
VALVPDGLPAGAIGAAMFARAHLATAGSPGARPGSLTDVASDT